MNTPTGSTLALVELDNAGEVFAELGQASMDLFLDEFSRRVQRFVREGDELIKVQPHKYCVVLHRVSDPIQLELAGAKLHRLFEAPIGVVDEEIKPIVHSAFVPPLADGNDSKRRMRMAESGLNDARRQNRFFVIRDAPVESDAVSIRRVREVELAFERGEFVMYYQPLVHAGYGNVVSAEALMRWHDPRHGVRPPSEFIPYLDQCAVHGQVTWFAVKAAIAQASRWPRAASVAVNVSPVLLKDEELLPTVRDALSIFGLPAERLTLEITEEAMLADEQGTLSALAQLRALGVRIAIDDFGTGYSSLAAFRDLPVDVLKVDSSFVTNMLEHPRDHDIVRAIIDLAHTFRMKVVAEGVEDAETAEALRELGADLLQGYWFGKPMPAESFVKVLG
ncbi:MAG: putative bifunctional diguanylate cyclase/phosphodiesterase [Pseudomonadales bacterium]